MKTKLLIFGITGDLAQRKLLPALVAIRRSGAIPDLQIIGVSRREVTTESIFEKIEGAAELEPTTTVFQMNLEDEDEYVRLQEMLDLHDDEQLLAYLSVPPAAAGDIIRFMGEAGLNTPNVKLMIEKPFGVDLVSAREMVDRISMHYKEAQVYRIDHYLAKQMAQNLVVVRAKNPDLKPIWNNDAVERIEIDALEEIGLENRASFYEQTGALRDVVQSHLLQLLALVLMDISPDIDWAKIPEQRLEALRQIMPADSSDAVRAQYAGYQDEAGNPGSRTETYVRATLHSQASQWQGVPLVLTHGKALEKKLTEIRIIFKKHGDDSGGSVVFALQPRMEIKTDLVVSREGQNHTLSQADFHIDYPSETSSSEAYERVLIEAAEGRKSLFPTGDEVLESWRIIQPILDAWSFSDDDVPQYKRGSSSEEIGEPPSSRGT